ncbi:hypothetical protein PPACK8108_LOCUS7360 [Phakopsora pachyrhizi]|uniref:Uncharacterized protein n=1 Tax=Phakopsora pachyrhizi TaxID=170000 RepID=A0AAV0AUE9_PHAPC|nr:hypothetical protein PPACK8108_LOCUS7360 [Phakopsora pachyrhizi]
MRLARVSGKLYGHTHKTGSSNRAPAQEEDNRKDTEGSAGNLQADTHTNGPDEDEDEEELNTQSAWYSDCLFQPKISAVETFLHQRALQDCCPRALLGSEEPQPSNQTTDPESIDHQSEFTAVSILSSQQMTVVNLQSDLQNSSSSSLPVSLRLPLSPTTRSRLTPKSKSTSTTKPAAIRPHTPDLTNSRPKSPSQINLANLVENWGGGGPSELSYRLPDPPSPISAFEINLSTQSNDSQSSLNHSLNQDQRCPMYHQPKVQVRSGLGHQVLGQTVDPKPLPNHDLPQRTLTIQALPPSEHPESNRSNTPGQSWLENLPNHQLSSKLEIEHKDEDSEEEDTDDDFLGNE